MKSIEEIAKLFIENVDGCHVSKEEYYEPKPFFVHEDIQRFVRQERMPKINFSERINASYNWNDDLITIPHPHLVNETLYYHVLFHEIGHSTHHPNRLNINSSGAFMYTLFRQHPVTSATLEFASEICVYQLFAKFNITYTINSLIAVKKVKQEITQAMFEEGMKKAAILAEQSLDWLGV